MLCADKSRQRLRPPMQQNRQQKPCQHQPKEMPRKSPRKRRQQPLRQQTLVTRKQPGLSFGLMMEACGITDLTGKANPCRRNGFALKWKSQPNHATVIMANGAIYWNSRTAMACLNAGQCLPQCWPGMARNTVLPCYRWACRLARACKPKHN